MLSKFVSFIKSRYFITSLLFIICALCVWFLGPMFGIGDWHPLEPKLIRIFVIVWFLCLAICVVAKWTLVPLILITAVILVWFTTPLLSFSDSKPFESVSSRVILLSIIFFIAIIYSVFRLLKALQKDPELFNKIFRNKNKLNTDPDLIKTSNTFDKKIAWTLAQLKTNTLRNNVALRPFRKKNYLYSIPWFLSIGSSRSGKTTSILNSGIQLTDPIQVRNSTPYLSINSDAIPTENCDVWLSHEAVFVDASGKYLDNIEENRNTLWSSLLSSLKRHRPKTPINGVVINISVEEILFNTDTENLKLAANIREQVLQTKKELGILFPVYLSVTKADKIIGFKEYFRSLTEDGRLHPWGFSLPLSKEFVGRSSNEPNLTVEKIQQEMAILLQELEKNLLARLDEEQDTKDKLSLYALPEEFKSVAQKVTSVINAIFIESSFGLPELNQSLRGVFFVSALQDTKEIPAKEDTILQRYNILVGKEEEQTPTHLTGNKAFFLSDFFKKMLIPEGNLAKSNREWQAKNTFFRFLIHALILIVFAWFAYSFDHSYEANASYLSGVELKTKELDNRVAKLYRNFKQEDIPDVLDLALSLPQMQEWDLKAPLLETQYGLYTPPTVITAADYTYTKLTDNLLLSQLVNRMETVMQDGLQTKNSTSAAEALNAYLMLNELDESHYNYKIIKDWVSKDWMENSQQYNFGGKSSVFEHLNNLFVPNRIVKSPFLKNEELVKAVRQLLDTQSSSTRIYNRTKSLASLDSPKDFTLVSVIGPEASTAFRFVSGKNLDYGVPGIYTYDGYHNVFKPKLKAIVAEAILNDKWLMGRNNEGNTKNIVVNTALIDDIKKQYLNDYANIWSAFIADIDAATGDTLAYDINVLRVYASPNSPLSRLSQAIVKETTLLQEESNELLGGQIASQVNDTTLVSSKTKKIAELSVTQAKSALSQEALLEKTLVDDHFSTLREMVTGQADFSNKEPVNATPSANPSTQPPVMTAAITSLDGYNSLINELYMYTSVANTTIATGGLPQANSIETRARFEAERLPPPFKKILTSLVISSTSKIKLEKESILTKQAQVQFDELAIAFNSQVNNVCKQEFASRYPFAINSPYEVSIDSFSQYFATNGTVDKYFNQYLVNYVDTSVKPWKYKKIEQVNIKKEIASAQSGSNAQAPTNLGVLDPNEPTLEGEYLKLLVTQGPNPEFFSTADDIKQAYFQDGGQKLMITYQYDIEEVDPMITELVLNFDGNIQRYMHNPFKPQELSWPSARLSGAEVEIMALPRIRADSSTIQYTGPWALFKFLDRSKLIHSSVEGKSLLDLSFEDRRVLLQISTANSKSPLNLNTIRKFKCP